MSFTGPNEALQLFGITLIGVTPENGAKLLLTLIVILVVVLVSRFLHALVGKAAGGVSWPRAHVWARQAVNTIVALITSAEWSGKAGTLDDPVEL